MRFSIISPVAGLQKFSSLSTTHLLLAHVDNPLYWSFYRQLTQEPNKQILILDNSAYEGQMNMEVVKSRLEAIRPTVLVLPDYCGQSAELTFNAAKDFLAKERHRWPFDFMYIPQFDGSLKDYKAMRSYLDVMIEGFGIKWIGLPRIMAERGWSRAELCIAVKRMAASWADSEPYVHAFGMCNGSLKEFFSLDEAQCDSCDSSAPVWRGWQGYDIEASQAWAQHGTPCNFDIHPDTLTPEREHLILSNLRKVGIQC
jgi:hypothetical protein